jgi:hypothetical protein
MLYEHRSQPLLPWPQFVGRLWRSFFGTMAFILLVLSLGILGYHGFGKLAWLDSLVDASMILGGMGPVNPITTAAGKWFASIYALFCGVALLTSVGVMLTPIYHRMMHGLHLDTEGGGK